MELITNRTASDVERAKSLLDKGWDNMIGAERNVKYAYNGAFKGTFTGMVAE